MTIATSGHSFAFTCVCVGGWIHMRDWAYVHTCASCRVAVLVYGWMCVRVCLSVRMVLSVRKSAHGLTMQHAVVVDVAWDSTTRNSSLCQLTCLRRVEGQRMGTNFRQIGPTLCGTFCLGMWLHVRMQLRLRARCWLVLHTHSPWCRTHPRKFWRVFPLASDQTRQPLA